MYDIVIKGGTIITGDSTKKYISDIGIKDKRIAKTDNEINEGEKNNSCEWIWTITGYSICSRYV